MKQSQGTMSALGLLETKARECQGQSAPMVVAPEVVLSLIEAARELESVKSAFQHMAFVRAPSPEQWNQVDNERELLELARELGWKEPTNGR